MVLNAKLLLLHVPFPVFWMGLQMKDLHIFVYLSTTLFLHSVFILLPPPPPSPLPISNALQSPPSGASCSHFLLLSKQTVTFYLLLFFIICPNKYSLQIISILPCSFRNPVVTLIASFLILSLHNFPIIPLFWLLYFTFLPHCFCPCFHCIHQYQWIIHWIEDLFTFFWHFFPFHILLLPDSIYKFVVAFLFYPLLTPLCHLQRCHFLPYPFKDFI